MKKSKEEMHNALQEVVNTYDNNQKVPVINRESNVAIFVVDMINDFTFTSVFQNPLAVELIPKLEKFLKKASDKGKTIFHINEAHSKESVEFLTFPEHGVKGSKGAEIVEQLKKIPYERVFFKNSTNGIHNNNIKKWIDEHPQIDTIIVTGVLADMCVMQFVIGAKTYCNEINRDVKFIVPLELVETSEYEGHNRDLFYYMALEFMSQGGINIVKNIDFE